MAFRFGALSIILSRFGRIWILAPGVAIAFEPQPIRKDDLYGFTTIYIEWLGFYWSTR